MEEQTEVLKFPPVFYSEYFYAFLKLKNVFLASKSKKVSESGTTVAAQMFSPFSLSLKGRIVAHVTD